MKIIPSRQWHGQVEENLFFSDLRATLDDVLCGEIREFVVDEWLAHKGYRLNWKNYDLEKIQKH